MVSFIWALIFFPSWAFAEALSFNDCINMLIRNDEILAAQAIVTSQQNLLMRSQGGFLPKFSGVWSYQAGNFRTLPGIGENSSQSASLLVKQNLFDGFATTSDIELKKVELKNAELQLKSVKSKISFDFRNAFSSMVYAQEAEKLSQKFLKRREENYRLVQLRFNSGRENKGSLLLSKAYLEQANWDLLKAKNNKTTGLSDLRRVLGRTDEGIIELTGAAPAVEIHAEVSDYNSLVLQTPEFQEALAQIEVSRVQVELSKAAFFPTLNLSGQFGRYEDQLSNEKDRWSVGVEFTFPFFDGGKDHFAIQSAKAAEYSNRHRVANLERDLITRIKKARLSLLESKEEYKVSEAFLLAANTRAEVARAKYNNGVRSFDEWDLIENDLILKSKDFLMIKKSVAEAEAAWEQVRGLGVLP